MFSRRDLLSKDSFRRAVLRDICLKWSLDRFTSSTIFMDQATKPCIGFLIMLWRCRSHGTRSSLFLKTVPLLLMKTDSVFIPLRNFKLAVIAKETSTVISVITHTSYELQCLMINLEFCLQCYTCLVCDHRTLQIRFTNFVFTLRRTIFTTFSVWFFFFWTDSLVRIC